MPGRKRDLFIGIGFPEGTEVALRDQGPDMLRRDERVVFDPQAFLPCDTGQPAF